MVSLGIYDGNALLAWTWGLLLIDGWKLFLTLHLRWDAKCTSLAPNSLDLDRMQSQMGGAAGMQTPTTGMSGMSGYSQMGPGPAPQHQGAYMGQMSSVQMRQQHLRQQQQLMALQQQQQQQQQQQVRPSLAVGGVDSCRRAGQVRWGVRDALDTHIPLPVVFLSSFLCTRPLLHSNGVGGGLPCPSVQLCPALSREFLLNHQPFVLKLGVVVHIMGQSQCHAKKLDCSLQGQVYSEGFYDQNMTVSTRSSKLKGFFWKQTLSIVLSFLYFRYHSDLCNQS